MLYQTVAEHDPWKSLKRDWPAFLERAEEHGGLPRFVVKEFEEYLRCGLLEHGCLHLECRECGYPEVVTFSCKKRGFCPSCLGRRMADTAVHLEQSVLPRVPIRHWICSLPWGLRALLGYDRKLCSEVVSAFMAEVDHSLFRDFPGSSLRWRAKRQLGLASVADAHTGGVVAVQRTESALRLNVHLHSLVLDGVYVHENDDPCAPLEFRELDTPTHADIGGVAARTAARIEKILRAHGRSLDPELSDDTPPELALDDPWESPTGDEPGLAACYDPWKSPTGDITRPPVAQDRLERRADGKLELGSMGATGAPSLTSAPSNAASKNSPATSTGK